LESDVEHRFLLLHPKYRFPSLHQETLWYTKFCPTTTKYFLPRKTTRIHRRAPTTWKNWPISQKPSSHRTQKCNPRKDALEVKLLERKEKLGYNTMKDRLKKVWKLQKGFAIMDKTVFSWWSLIKPIIKKSHTWWPLDDFYHCLDVSCLSPEFASQMQNLITQWFGFVSRVSTSFTMMKFFS